LADIDVPDADLARLREGDVTVPLPEDQSDFDVLAVVFDLQGFTAFCDQRDPHTFVPAFVERFREWILRGLAANLTDIRDEAKAHRVGAVPLYAPPPFFLKFLGDGLLLLWRADASLIKEELPDGLRRNAQAELEGDLTNIVSAIFDLMNEYPTFAESLPFTNTPIRHRVGAARGRVCSVAMGESVDFVGPCINQAARLQKLGALGFAIDSAGMPDEFEHAPDLRPQLIAKEVPIRGARKARAFLAVEEWVRLSDEEQDAVLNGR
jgi:class 3 adenylate cyclase